MEKALRACLAGGKFNGISEQRSEAMRSVRSKANKTTEARLRFAMVQAGIVGWKIMPSSLLGNPDFIFSEIKLAIFTDGCFWHGCPVCHHSKIKSHSRFWTEKINRNRTRDRKVTRKLRSQGWSVLRMWEHELRDRAGLQRCIYKLRRLLNRYGV
jgi:DNA mismatch endonuclease (patch repair protein)